MTPRWVLVSGDFTPLGGMDVANLALARHLARTARVDVVTHRAWDDLHELPNVAVHEVWRPFGKHLLGEPLLASAGRRVARRSPEGTRVVVNGGNCRWFDVTWVHYVHAAYDPGTGGGPFRWVKDIVHRRRSLAGERAVLTRARVVVCNSHLTARHAVERVGVPADRVRVVYYGCDPAALAPVAADDRRRARAELGWDDRPWVGFVGALGDARKGFDTLYAAWRELCRGVAWDANLAVIGSGAQLPVWEARAKADGLAGRVRFLGFRKDVPRVLAACDVLVHPARYEAYGLGVHEALCRGLPAVVSASAGVAERFPEELTGLLLPDPEDAPGLADRLRAWRRELEAWPGRVAGLSATLRGRTWDDMAAEFVSAVK